MKHPLLAVLGRTCLLAAVVLVVLAAVHKWQIVVLLAGLIFYVQYRRGALVRPSEAYGNARWCDAEEAQRAGLFRGRGLFLGRFAGPPSPRLNALLRLFTLPIGQSDAAVRQFLSAWTRR